MLVHAETWDDCEVVAGKCCTTVAGSVECAVNGYRSVETLGLCDGVEGLLALSPGHRLSSARALLLDVEIYDHSNR